MARSYFEIPPSPYLVPFEGGFKVKAAATVPPKGDIDKTARKTLLKERVAEISALQDTLYAQSQHSLLLVFQAMDAAGKDSTIRSVLSGVDPTGCHVTAFKRPSLNELEHDFLWRTTLALPDRGRIGVFNRSYYEEVLAVKVHPEFLKAQQLPFLPRNLDELWEERYDSIREHEKHLARNGTIILKFWLNVSRGEQRERFLKRLDEPEKNWKFESGDLHERTFWKDYMRAYEDALNETSRPWAPWFAIPADSKSHMSLAVADIVVQTLKNLKLRYPELDPSEKAKLGEMRAALMKDHY